MEREAFDEPESLNSSLALIYVQRRIQGGCVVEQWSVAPPKKKEFKKMKRKEREEKIQSRTGKTSIVRGSLAPSHTGKTSLEMDFSPITYL